MTEITPEDRAWAEIKHKKITEDIARMKNPKLALIDEIKEDINNYKFHLKLNLTGQAKITNQEIIKTLSDRIKSNKKKLGM